MKILSVFTKGFLDNKILNLMKIDIGPFKLISDIGRLNDIRTNLVPIVLDLYSCQLGSKLADGKIK